MARIHAASQASLAKHQRRRLRQAAKYNLNVWWNGPSSCWLRNGHHVEVSGDFVARLLVTLDAALEAGMPVNRKLPDLAPTGAKGTKE